LARASSLGASRSHWEALNESRRIATLTFAALLSAVVSATAQTINISSLDPGGPYSGTALGNTQNVVSNQHGYFATYVPQADVDLFAATWRWSAAPTAATHSRWSMRA
jgi:hypothetical protein